MTQSTKPQSYIAGASVYLISTIVAFFVNILVLPVYTRLLTPEEYGIIIIFVIFGKLVAGFFHFSLHDATYRYYFEYENDFEEFKKLNSSNFLFIIFNFIVSYLIIVSTSNLFYDKIFEGQLTPNLISLALISGFLDYILLYLMTLLTAQVRAKEHSIMTILYMLISSLLSMSFMFFFSLTYMGRIYGIILSQILSIIVLLILCKSLFTIKLSYKLFKKSFRYSLPYYPIMLLGLSQNYLDKTILSSTKGTKSLAQYSIGINFAIVLKQIMDSVSKAWNPFFLSNALKNTVESKKVIIEKFYSMAVVFMIIGLAVTYFSEEAIKLLTTKEYHFAVWITPIYIYFYLFAIVGYLTNMQLSAAKKMKYLIPGTIVSGLVNVILNITLIPLYGMIGAAISAAVTSLITQLFLFYFAMKVFPLQINKKRILTLYLLLTIFTLPAYLIYALSLNLFLKIIIKIILIYLFTYICINRNFISKEYILNTLANYRYFNRLAPLIKPFI